MVSQTLQTENTMWVGMQLRAANMQQPQSACMFVDRCLATKVFVGKLPATRGVWVIIE